MSVASPAFNAICWPRRIAAPAQRLLDQIFAAEEQLAPDSTALFDRSRRAGHRTAVALRDLQRVLGPDEVFLEYVLLDPTPT